MWSLKYVCCWAGLVLSFHLVCECACVCCVSTSLTPAPQGVWSQSSHPPKMQDNTHTHSHTAAAVLIPLLCTTGTLISLPVSPLQINSRAANCKHAGGPAGSQYTQSSDAVSAPWRHPQSKTNVHIPHACKCSEFTCFRHIPPGTSTFKITFKKPPTCNFFVCLTSHSF